MVVVYGVIAVIIAYLFGSIPAAYITTRLQTGKDIRKLGSGNAGAHNVLQNVGFWAAFVTGLFDVGKGAVAVFTARWILGFPDMKIVGVPQAFVLAAALAVVAGHIWSLYLRFTGGNGLSPTIGSLAVLLPVELLLALGITVVLAVITRNLVLSVNISLLTVVPTYAILSHRPWPFIVFVVILILMLVLHFVPDIKAASVKAGSRDKLVAELLRVEKETPKKRSGKRKN